MSSIDLKNSGGGLVTYGSRSSPGSYGTVKSSVASSAIEMEAAREQEEAKSKFKSSHHVKRRRTQLETVFTLFSHALGKPAPHHATRLSKEEWRALSKAIHSSRNAENHGAERFDIDEAHGDDNYYHMTGGDDSRGVVIDMFVTHLLHEWRRLTDTEFKNNIRWLSRAAVVTQDEQNHIKI